MSQMVEFIHSRQKHFKNNKMLGTHIFFFLFPSKFVEHLVLGGKGLTVYHTIPLLTTQKTSLSKTLWEKENILVTSIFLLFPQCFLPFPKQIPIFQSCLICHLQTLSIWTSPEFFHLVKS